MIGKLLKAIDEKNAPVVAGLDPTLELIPDCIKDAAFKKCGETLEGAAEAIIQFNKRIIDKIYDIAPAVKPQIAMYERFGLPGLLAYKETIDCAHEKGLIVIGDVKRGDIGSTSEAYADAHLGSVKVGANEFVPFGEDFCTVNPYLGTDGVKPFVDVAKRCDKGIFVLVKTSNPSSGEFQDKKFSKGDATLYETVGDMVEKWGEELIEDGYSSVGAVIGCTYPEVGKKMRERLPHVFVLVPGYGAQGGTAEDLKVFFDKEGRGAIVNSSRGIIGAWKKEPYKSSFSEEQFDEAARKAVLDMIEDINKAIGR